MTTVFEIPLSATPQRFSISLDGVTYRLVVTWCEPNQAWTLDIHDVDDNPIIRGIPLVTGANLLAQYEYLGVPGQLVVQSDNNPNAVPTFETLGGLGHLYYLTADA